MNYQVKFLNLLVVLTAFLMLYSCQKDDEIPAVNKKAFVVDKIYNYDNYTYNEHGIPSSIEVKWKDIETSLPMLLRIEYKEIE